MTTSTAIITASARAFSGSSVKRHSFLVGPDGSVNVWDRIAGHCTSVHAMSARTMRRIAALSKAEGRA